MTTLTDRLNALAEDAPDGEGVAGLDGTLWARGRTLQRRRRAVGASLAVVLVLAIGSMAALMIDVAGGREIPAADADTALALPDRLYHASPWLDGTDEVGPIGPLVALVGSERRTFWGERSVGVTGVSVTGTYAFLDLPDRAETLLPKPVVLSADGRLVAYLVTGPTEAEAYTGAAADPVVGVAVYDTVTGRVQRQLIDTDHGLDLYLEGPFWIGRTLVLPYGQYASPDGDGTTRRAVLRWDLDTGEVDPALPAGSYPDLAGATSVGDMVVVNRGRRGFDVVAADGTVTQGPRFDTAMNGPVFATSDGSLVASYEDASTPQVRRSGGEMLVVADVRGDDAGVTRTVPGTKGSQLVGWRDNEHIIVVGDVKEAVSGYVAVDVASGQREPLVELPLGVGGFGTQVATDALTAPTFVAPEPDGPGDPRRMIWLGSGIVALLGGLVVWRHRVRL